MVNKTILCTSLNPKVIDILSREEPDCIYCYQKSLEKINNSFQDKISYIRINDCKRFINKVDLIIVDLKLENKEQYLSLKTLLKLLLASNLKPDLKLLCVKDTETSNISDENRIYQDYINYFLEGVIKFRGLGVGIH